MPTYTKEEKAQRKHTIKMHRDLQLRDRIEGIRPTAPGRVIHHPRAYNKPLSCQAGRHTWVNTVVMGTPWLYCKKCGAGVVKDVHEGTMTKREMRMPTPNPIARKLI